MGGHRTRVAVAALLAASAVLIARGDQGVPVYVSIPTYPVAGGACTGPRIQVQAGASQAIHWCCIGSVWVDCSVNPEGATGTLQVNGGSGAFGAFGGASCATGYFPTSMGANGVWGCSQVDWSQLTGVPATFPPSAHTHAGSDVTSQVASAAAADSVPWTGITGVPGSFTPSGHTHPGGDVTSAVGSATALAANGTNCATGEAAAGVDASGSSEGCFVPPGTYVLPDATSLVTGGVRLTGDLGGTAVSPTVPGLAGKANTTHAHAAGDVTSGTLAGAQGGGGAALPTCAGTDKLTANGTAWSCATDQLGSYTLAAATATVLGGVKGTGASLVCSGTDKATGFGADGTLQCAADQGSAYVLPDATDSVTGGVRLTNDFGGTATAPTVVATHLVAALPLTQGGTGSTSTTACTEAQKLTNSGTSLGCVSNNRLDMWKTGGPGEDIANVMQPGPWNGSLRTFNTVSGITGFPGAAGTTLQVDRANDTSSSATGTFRLWSGTADPALYHLRYTYGSGWTTAKLWSDLIDGTGSGLDADLLDGQHGSYYAPLASPAFTGTITLNGLSHTFTPTYSRYFNTGLYLDQTSAATPNTGTNLSFQNGGVNRWIIRGVNNEAGGNTGYDLNFISRDDAGAGIANVLVLRREVPRVGINTVQPAETLDVLGPAKLGSQNSTLGADWILGTYSGSGYLGTLFGRISSGGPALGYGLRAGTSFAYASSTPANVTRSALDLRGDELYFVNAPAQTTAIGSVVNVTERFRVSSAGDLLTGTGRGLDTNAAGTLVLGGTNATGIQYGRTGVGVGHTWYGSVGNTVFDGTGARIQLTRAGPNYITATHSAGTLALGAGGTEGHLVIGTSGAATFSSSVTATGAFASDSYTGRTSSAVNLNASSGYTLSVAPSSFVDPDSGAAYLDVYSNNKAYRILHLNAGITVSNGASGVNITGTKVSVNGDRVSGIKMLAADVNANGSTPVALTGLSMSLASGATYAIDCQVFLTNLSTTNGARVAVTSPAVTASTYTVETMLFSSTAKEVTNATAAGTWPGTCFSSCVAHRYAWRLAAVVNPSAAGTWSLSAVASAAGTSLIASKGSWCHFKTL